MIAFIQGERVICARRAAEKIGVSERAIRGWASRGVLPGIKIGKLWVFKDSVIEEKKVVLSRLRRDRACRRRLCR